MFVGYGAIVPRLFDAQALLKERGVDCGVILTEQLAPYEETAKSLLPYLRKAKAVLFAEETVRDGGAGIMLADRLMREDASLLPRFKIAAVEDPFRVPDRSSDFCELHGLSALALAERLQRFIKSEKDV